MSRKFLFVESLREGKFLVMVKEVMFGVVFLGYVVLVIVVGVFVCFLG